MNRKKNWSPNGFCYSSKPVNHLMKMEESDNTEKYPDLVKKLGKNKWNMKVMMIPFVVGGLGTVPKCFGLE